MNTSLRSTVLTLAGPAVIGGLLLVGVIAGRFTDASWPYWLILTSLGVGLLSGVGAALDSLRQRTLDIDVLMVLGAVFAAAIGHAEEGALLLFLFVLAGKIESLAHERTMRAVEALHKLMPAEVIVHRGGEWVSSEPKSLSVGERIKVRLGDLVPVDARVEAGSSDVDQSTLTGESLPRAVTVGDELYAGSVNLGDALEAVVLRPVADSSLQKILDLVSSAQQQRLNVQRLIDRIGQPYSVGVIVASLAVFLVWMFVFGDPWDKAGYTAITLLIVASPCALIIATPTATLAAIARAARAGVLFKGGQAMERLARTGSVCFDKTGTLTAGRPRMAKVDAVAWSDAGKLLAVAAGLERDSTHPIATAVLDEADRRGIAPMEVTKIQAIPGAGVRGIFDGRYVCLGSDAFVEPAIPVCLLAHVRTQLAEVHGSGRLAVVVVIEGDEEATNGVIGQAGILVMEDEVRPGADVLAGMLGEMGIGPVCMLTGDNRVTAGRVAEELGIGEVYAELLPEQKVEHVRRMRADGLGVLVIGDGVNDAPALASADVSMAVGSIGTDAALETADIILLNDHLEAIPWAIRLARRATSTIAVNITIALSVILVMGLLVLVGSRTGFGIPLSVGVLAHEGGTLLVVLNSITLLWLRGAGDGMD